MRIAFWNTHKSKKINEIVSDIICENKIDIMVLAEYEDDSHQLLQSLCQKGIGAEQYMTFGCERIVMFGSIKRIIPASQNKYYSIQLIDKKYILCGMHLPSQVYANHQDRRNIVIDTILQDINELEDEVGCDHTIILGDLNENPYESGCLAADKFHGVPSGDDARKGMRNVMGKTFKMFYNPMWNLFGDFEYPPGTCYYNGSSPKNSFWNIYDQVMIRPRLRDQFVEKSLKILTETKKDSLVDQYRHPRRDISDHLPVVFEIKEGKL